MGASATIGNWLAFAGATPFLLPVMIVLATFVLEDATTILVGVLAADGQVGAAEALLALYAGIVLGDFGLYALGRLAGGHRWAERLVEHETLAPFRTWLETRLVFTVFTVRFVPGLRLPTYTASGFFKLPFRRFAVTVVAATTIWTTLLFAASYFFGAVTADTLGVWRLPLGLSVAVLLFFWARSNAHKREIRMPGRIAPGQGDVAAYRIEAAEKAAMPSLAAPARPLSSFETTPAFFFYLPVAAYWLWLSIRHRSFTLPTLANPSITAGGLCGESKTEVLELLGPIGRSALAAFTSLATRADPAENLRLARASMERAGLEFPVVAKPDRSRRGTGVRLVRTEAELGRYLRAFPTGRRLLLQRYVPFEGEAGVFYRRAPGEMTGRIASLTLKYFPYVVGDGRSTLKDLVLSDPRAGLVPQLYLPRLQGDLGRVLAPGEKYRLVFVGNHCRGAIFRNGEEFVTEAMTARFDEIAKEMPDFYFGRFDVRFDSFQEFQRGKGFVIIEANGAGSEVTHIWDANMTLKGAYRALFDQVRSTFEIGAVLRRKGYRPLGALRLLALYFGELRLMRNYPTDRAAS